jgi:hypothetical protein
MLMIVCRSSLLEDLLGELGELGVSATTQLPNVHGVGQVGSALGSFPAPASNAVVLVALEDADADRVAVGIRGYRDRMVARQRGAPVPLRVFMLPCDQVF